MILDSLHSKCSTREGRFSGETGHGLGFQILLVFLTWIPVAPQEFPSHTICGHQLQPLLTAHSQPTAQCGCSFFPHILGRGGLGRPFEQRAPGCQMLKLKSYRRTALGSRWVCSFGHRFYVPWRKTHQSKAKLGVIYIAQITGFCDTSPCQAVCWVIQWE